MSLAGHVAVVTGAGGGMGLAIARQLARAGAALVLNDLGEAPLQASAQALRSDVGAVALALSPGDITTAAGVAGLADTAQDAFGRAPSILVNNAGLLFPTRVADIAAAEWHRVMEVNLTAAFLCAQALIPHMRAQRWGRIVNMSSSAGRSVSTLGGAHYTAAKAGLLGLTRALAKEVAADGICVNAVCPGLIDTAMVRGHCAAERIDAYEASFPISRLGHPDEVAELVVFLCAQAAYITGASIDINGGDLMI